MNFEKTDTKNRSHRCHIVLVVVFEFEKWLVAKQLEECVQIEKQRVVALAVVVVACPRIFFVVLKFFPNQHCAEYFLTFAA